MAKEKILVVEDDENILELVTYNLKREGYSVTGVSTGELALAEARKKKPDLILLDLMLPGIDGLEVCKLLKKDEKTAHIAIVMMTARSEEADVVSGLELGSDDYITKPFSPRVLVSRVKSVLRRAREGDRDTDAVVQIHDLLIHPGRHEVRFKGKKVDLTLTEFRILHLLARKPGWVYSRDQIVESVQGDDYPVTQRSIDVQIVGLRKKLGTSSSLIETVRGIGYRFKG